MYKKMVNPLAHGVSKHHLLKEAPESKPSDEESRSWENATQKALFDKVDDWNSDWNIVLSILVLGEIGAYRGAMSIGV